MRRKAPHRLLLLLALVLCAPAPTTACADATDDAIDAFKKALRTEVWEERREAYMRVADYDSGAVARAVLDALEREPNPAVQLVGLRVLGGLGTEDAQAQLVTEARKARGSRKMLVLLALARQRGTAAAPILLEVVQDKDGPAAAQAALALGKKEVHEAIPHLVALLGRKDWQVRRAAALALANIAQPPPPEPKDGKPTPKDFRWPVPDALKAPEVTKALIAALAEADGVDRGAILRALAEIHEQDHGDNLAAWKLVAEGKPVDAAVAKKRDWPPAVFGIPLYGRRIVFIYDNSLRSGDPHNFGTGDRLLELCAVPGGVPLLATRLLTVGQFAQAHLTRAIGKIERGQQFELIAFNASVQPLFGKFSPSSAASRKLVEELFTGMTPDDGINTYGALTAALDLGGDADAKAWKKGPDEIVFITCNQPTVGELKDADVIAAAIGLKARMRMVRVHTVGILTHPYSMLETMAAETGGIYRNYYE
ncbi:MAG: HEAT repeat domain-containing protein [Planctomycetota bacterium]|nr:HEAT repeat domain-containing protein [Planctomycetota bacterium]